MLNINWKIHKRLLDAGGLGPVVYILPARGGSKLSMERERCLQLLAEGRMVVYVRPNPRPKSIFIDRDILTPERYERAERIWNEVCGGYTNPYALRESRCGHCGYLLNV